MNKTVSKPALYLTVATVSDAETLSRIAIQGFCDTFGFLYEQEYLEPHLEKYYSASYFATALAGDDTIIMAYWDGAAAGYAKAGKVGLPVEPDFPAMELQRLYVVEPYQGKKIGDALMQAVLELPMMRAAHGIYVGAWEENHRARYFYGKYGFKQVGEYIYRVGPQADRELIMLREQKPL